MAALRFDALRQRLRCVLMLYYAHHAAELNGAGKKNVARSQFNCSFTRAVECRDGQFFAFVVSDKKCFAVGKIYRVGRVSIVEGDYRRMRKQANALVFITRFYFIVTVFAKIFGNIRRGIRRDKVFGIHIHNIAQLSKTVNLTAYFFSLMQCRSQLTGFNP